MDFATFRKTGGLERCPTRFSDYLSRMQERVLVQSTGGTDQARASQWGAADVA